MKFFVKMPIDILKNALYNSFQRAKLTRFAKFTIKYNSLSRETEGLAR